MTRRPVFTHEGLALLTNARRIADEWDATLTSLKEDGLLTGPMRVTSTNDFGRVQLRPALDRIQALHPGIHRRLLLSDSTVNLIDEHIDLALRNGSLADSGLHALGIRTLLGSVRHDQWSGSYKPLRNCITFVSHDRRGSGNSQFQRHDQVLRSIKYRIGPPSHFRPKRNQPRPHKRYRRTHS